MTRVPFRLPMAPRKKQKAFVLVKADTGHEKQVMNNLLKLDSVREVHIVPGEWDLLAVIEVEKSFMMPPQEHVWQLVLEKIAKTEHVRDTNTMLPEFSKTK